MRSNPQKLLTYSDDSQSNSLAFSGTVLCVDMKIPDKYILREFSFLKSGWGMGIFGIYEFLEFIMIFINFQFGQILLAFSYSNEIGLSLFLIRN